MKKIVFSNPLLIHIVVGIFAFVTFGIVEGIDKLMINDFFRNCIFAIESVVIVVLYYILIKRFMNKSSKTKLQSSIVIILAVNVVLGLTSYLMTTFGTGLTVENGQFPIIILTLFNLGSMPIINLIELIVINDILNLVLMCIISPVLIFIISRATVTEYKNK